MPRSRHRDGRSSHARFTRRLRRTNKAMKRTLKSVATGGKQAYSTLLAVLAQKGGEVVITQGTIDQVTANYADLGFRVEKGDQPNEYKVLLVEGPEKPQETPGTTDAEEGAEHADESAPFGIEEHAAVVAAAMGRDEEGDLPANL